MKLINIIQPIAIISDNEAEWLRVNEILKENGYDVYMPFDDSIIKCPDTFINPHRKEYFNHKYNKLSDFRYTPIPASEFISDNTLADTTDNTNTPTTHSMNC